MTPRPRTPKTWPVTPAARSLQSHRTVLAMWRGARLSATAGAGFPENFSATRVAANGATMFAQVQGPGVSDEFKEPASGDVRLSWERWLAATFPEPTRFERVGSVAAEAALQRLLAPQGREMCASLPPPVAPWRGARRSHSIGWRLRWWSPYL